MAPKWPFSVFVFFVYLVDVVGVLKLVNDKEVVGTQKFNCRLKFDKIGEDPPGWL